MQYLQEAHDAAWKQIYEEVYKVKLSYNTEEK